MPKITLAKLDQVFPATPHPGKAAKSVAPTPHPGRKPRKVAPTPHPKPVQPMTPHPRTMAIGDGSVTITPKSGKLVVQAQDVTIKKLSLSVNKAGDLVLKIDEE